MTSIAILVVDDEQAFTEILAQRLGKRGFAVKTAADGHSGLKLLREDETIEVVVLDLAMPGMDGLETLKAMKKERPLVEAIMLTGQGSVNSAVEAIKQEAFNYLIKPCDIEDLSAFIHDAAEHRKNRQRKILDVRMTPYLSPEKRKELIAAILKE
ncbi:MAG: response regulator [Proteobacteria bacterium]|nr:response regulator [Pseudomonadota bacterium]